MVIFSKFSEQLDKKDKQLIKDSGLVIVDGVVSLVPGLNVAWGLSKALYGAGMKLRRQRALEWVEMVRDNPDVFTKSILSSEEFQDGFVYSLERYLVERNEEKRTYLKRVFLGFTKDEDKPRFALEKLMNVLAQLTSDDIRVLKDVDETRDDANYQVYGNENRDLPSIYNLVYLGILFTGVSSRWGPQNAPFVMITKFGRELRRYILD